MSDEPDVFDQLRIAVARMGTREPKDYSFAISVADAAVILERMAKLEAAVAAERERIIALVDAVGTEQMRAAGNQSASGCGEMVASRAIARVCAAIIDGISEMGDPDDK